MAKVDEIALIEVLVTNLRGAGFVTIGARTKVKLTAEGRTALGEVHKKARNNVTLNYVYERSVNRQREREGLPKDFKAEERDWGIPLEGWPLIAHYKKPVRKGEPFEPHLYLHTKHERSLGYSYEDAQGNPIPNDVVHQFLPERHESRQGVEREVIVRDYDLQNIFELVINGLRIA
jgi:hypothetical protein